MEQCDELICQGGGGQSHLVQAAQHDGVHHIHAHGDELLQGDGYGDGDQFFVEASLPNQKLQGNPLLIRTIDAGFPVWEARLSVSYFQRTFSAKYSNISGQQNQSWEPVTKYGM